VLLGIRPEDLTDGGDTSGSSITAAVDVVEPLGAETHIYLSTEANQFIAKVAPDADVRVGTDLTLKANMERVHYFDAETEASLTQAVTAAV
jgi:multiple sugar transport system ATP-binding protein